MSILTKLITATIIGTSALLTGCEGFKWYDTESYESASYYGPYPADQYNSYREYRQAMDRGQYRGNGSNFDKVYKPPKYYKAPGGNSSTSVSPSQYCTMVAGRCCYENTCTASCKVNPFCGGKTKKQPVSNSVGNSTEYDRGLSSDLKKESNSSGYNY